MALETGTYINDLTPSNPPASDPAGQGDDHIRLIKSTVQASLPNLGGIFGQLRRQDSAVTISSVWNTSRILVTNSATATVVLTMPASASVTSGFTITIEAVSAVVVVNAPSGGSINGGSAVTIPNGAFADVWFQGGTSWRAHWSPSGVGGATFDDVGVRGTLSVSGNTVFSGNVFISGTASFATVIDLQSGQIAFPATQKPSANPNTLDDYEEGTWTPALTWGNPGNQSFAYSVQDGLYVKVGQFVNLMARVTTSTFTHTTAAGSLFMTGIPFQNNAGADAYGTCAFSLMSISTSVGTPVARLSASTSQVDFIGSGISNNIAAVISVGNHVSGNNSFVSLNMNYRTTA